MADGDTPPRKKTKIQQHNQTFRTDYIAKFPCFNKSRKGPHFAYCTLCLCDVNLKGGGISDLERHVKTDKHQSNGKVNDNNRKITSTFTPCNDLTVTKAEVAFTNFIVENNLPIAVSDSCGKLFRNMFPDSEIAKKYGCGRTKSTAIIKELARNDSESISDQIRQSPYSIGTDGSNDIGDTKLYPIVVRYYDKDLGQVVTNCLTIPELSISSTGENIFNLINDEFSKKQITWKNCLSFAADNASVMSGCHKGVISYVKKKNEDIYFVGCASHLIHLAAEKGCKSLPVAVEDLLISIFYYLDKSASRQHELKTFQLLHDGEVQKILKHVSTRWLSLGVCLERVLDQWEPLQDFFREKYNKIKREKTVKSKSTTTVSKVVEQPKSKQTSTTNGQQVSKTVSKKPVDSQQSKKSETTSKITMERQQSKKSETTSKKTIDSQQSKKVGPSIKQSENEKKSKELSAGDKKVEKIYDMLRSRTMKLFCLFLKSNISIFDVSNKLLQNEKPCIHILHDVLVSLLEKLLCRFVKPSVMANSKSVMSVKFEDIENQKDNINLTIGAEAKAYIQKYEDVLVLEKFYASVRVYYSTICSYIMKKFPITDELLKNATVANLQKRTITNFSSVEFFMSRFEYLALKFKDLNDDLETEFLSYQVEDLSEEILNQDRVDVAWTQIGQICDATGNLKYKNLMNFMLSILVIFHSNVDCERVFSLVTKNKTKYRPNMNTDTLSALITHKQYMSSMGQRAFLTNPAQKVLKNCKSATYNSLN